MKFAQIAKGTSATKPVTFRLANAPPPPPPSAEEVAAGVSVVADPDQARCAVRVLTGGEQLDIWQRAQEDAAARGVPEWKADHPICKLSQMVRTILIACVDADDEKTPFFVSAEQIHDSRELGSDNIALLFEQQDHWQQECSFGGQAKAPGLDEMMHILSKEAERPENSAVATPYDSLRPGMQKQFVRTMAILFFGLLKGNSLSGSSSDSSIKSGSKKTRRKGKS